MSHPASITSQPYPFNLTTHRRLHRTRLPTYQRSNPYMETANDHLA